MAMEIERKFLIKRELFTPQEPGIRVRQGYLPQSEAAPLLVRVRQHNERAYLTLKGRTAGVSRAEYEYEIPFADSEELLALCEKPLIEKTRYLEKAADGHIWEVDIFFGENEGLIVAEVELKDENEPFERPAWLAEEVSGDKRYYNSNLGKCPFKKW